MQEARPDRLALRKLKNLHTHSQSVIEYAFDGHGGEVHEEPRLAVIVNAARILYHGLRLIAIQIKRLESEDRLCRVKEEGCAQSRHDLFPFFHSFISFGMVHFLCLILL
ncbi:Uncharacterised protein [Bacteroides xylanisolvens]|nr:Uncharacterised protein [Bacteroides xylanisolvens]